MKNLKFDLQRFATLTVSTADELFSQIAVASNGDTIQMLADVTVSEEIKISKDITLDLNGKTISTNDVYVFIVESVGKLTVTDTGTGGTISGANTAINNNFGVVEINGGTISGENDAIFNNFGVVEISGGTISGKDDAINNNGGTISISGGTFTGIDLGNDGIIYNNKESNGTISISGGTFNQDVSSYCANGYSATDNDDGTWTVSKSVTNDQAVSIDNNTANISINGSAYADTIENKGNNVTIDAGAGDDSISNTGDTVEIYAGDGANTVINSGYYDTISTGADADYISITGEYISLDAGEGNNTVEVYSSFNDTITTGSGDDSISVAKGSDLNISSGAGNDTIIGKLLGLEADDWSFGGSATIDAGAGDDYIAPLYSDHSSINGGEGNDTIINNGKGTSINGGAGNDYIVLTNDVTNAYETQVIIASEGNDTVTGVSDNVAFKGTFTNSAVDGNNVILTTDNGTLTIIDGKNKTLNINDDKQLVNGEIVDAAENTTIGAAFAEFMLKKTSKGYPALGDTDMLDPDTVGSEAPYNAYLTENWTIESEDGLKLSGVHYAPENPKGQWIVLVTGYGQVGATMNYPASILLNGDYDILVVEPRASGNSEGDWLTMGVAECVDVALWTQKIAETNANAQITLFGISMGAATVMMAAALSQTTNVTALIEDCGYANVYSVFEKVADRYAADFGWTGTNEELYEKVVTAAETLTGYNVADAVALNSVPNVTVPSLFIHGTEDTLVSVEDAQALYDASGAKDKEILKVEGAGHAQSITTSPIQYGLKAIEFLQKSNKEIGANIERSDSDTKILGTIYDDTIKATADNVTIEGNAGNDTITAIEADKISIDAGDGDDYVFNAFVYYDDDGNFISKYTYDKDGNLVEKVNKNSKKSTAATIIGGEGNDTLINQGIDYATVDAGEGNNFIGLYHSYYNTITTGSGNDSVVVDKGHYVNLSTGAGDDSIIGRIGTIEADSWSFGGYATIDAGEGNDYIAPFYANNSSIFGGAGDDTIINNGADTTIDGGAGDDYIELTSNYRKNESKAEGQTIIASAGNDTIKGYDENSVIYGDFTSSTLDGNDVIFTNAENTVRIIDAKDKTIRTVDSNGATNSIIVGGDGTVVTKTLAQGGTYTDSGDNGTIKYTATTDAELITDDSGVVTGINSGTVTAEIDGATDSPVLTLDGTTAFDFTASVPNEGGLTFKVGDKSITYVAGEATYTANNISFPAGQVQLKITSSFGDLLGTATVTVPAGGITLPIDSSSVPLLLSDGVSISFDGGLITGGLGVTGNISYDAENKVATFAEGAAFTAKDLTFGTIKMNFGLAANAESKLKVDGMNLVIKDGSDFDITGTILGFEGNLKVSGGDFSFGLLSMLTTESDITLDKGATLSFTPKNFKNPIVINAPADADAKLSLNENGVLSLTTDKKSPVSVTLGQGNTKTMSIVGTVDFDLQNKTFTVKKDTEIEMTTTQGVLIKGVASKDLTANIGFTTSNGLLQAGSDGGSSRLTLTLPEDNGFVITLSKDGQTLIENLELKLSGEFIFNSDGTVDISKGSTMELDYSDDYSVTITSKGEESGTLLLSEKGMTFTPSENDNKLELSVTKDGKTRTATLDVDGTLTYQLDGSISLDEGTVVKIGFEDGVEVTVTANTDASGTIYLTPENGLVVTPASKDAFTVTMTPSANVTSTYTSIEGTIFYSGGILTLSDGTSVAGTLTDPNSTIDMTAKVSGGTASIQYSANGAVFTANDGATLTQTFGTDQSITFSNGSLTVVADSGVMKSSLSEGTVVTNANMATPYILEKAGEYSLNGNTITTTEDNVEVSFSDKNTITFDTHSEVTVKGHKVNLNDGTKVKVSSDTDEIALVMYKPGTSTLDGRTFTLTDEVENGMTVYSSDNLFTVSRIIAEFEVEKYGYDAKDVGKEFAEAVVVSNDDTFTVRIKETGIDKVEGVSNGASFSVAAVFDGKPDEQGNNFTVVTDEAGKFKFGTNTYEVTGDNSVEMKLDFDKKGNGVLSTISDLNGTVEGKIGTEVTVNGTKITLAKGSDDATILAEGNNITISGLAKGEEITFDSENVSVKMTEEKLTVNGVTYELKGDSDGVTIKGTTITGLDENATLKISTPGTYNVNSKTLEIKKGDSAVGVSETEATLKSAMNANSTTDEIREELGIDEEKVESVGGSEFERVTLPDTPKSTAVIPKSTTGEKKVTMGNKGSAAIVEGTEAIVSISGGAGKDSLVSSGEDVTFDMSANTRDKVMVTNGQVTLDNYNPDTNAGIKLTNEQESAGIVFGLGKVALGKDENAPEVTFGKNDDNFVNIYTPENKGMRVGFASAENKTVDASDSDKNMVLVGGDGQYGEMPMSLAEEITNASLLGGSGNDTIFGGKKSYIDPGAGKNQINMSDKGGSTVNYTEGKATIDNFNFVGNTENVDADKIQTGELAISDVMVMDDNVLLKTDKGNIQVNNAAGKTMVFNNEHTNGDININVADEALDVKENGLYWAAGKDATVSLANYANTDTVVADLTDYHFDTNKDGLTFAGDIKELNAKGYAGKATLTGNSGDNVITASDGGSTIHGGDGNDTFVGGDGTDEIFVGSGNNVIQKFTSDDKINTEDNAIQSVKIFDDDVMLITEEGNVKVEDMKGKAFNFQNNHTDGNIKVTIEDTALDVKEKGLYWAAGKNATVSLANYTDKTSVIADLSNYHFDTNKEGLTFAGDIKELNATNYTGKAELTGNNGDNIITAGNGNSTLWGGEGTGNDTLIGGNGNDVFIYNAGNGNDLIQGADNKDTIKLGDITLDNISNLDSAFSSSGNDLTFNIGNGSLTIENGKTSGVAFEISNTKYTVNNGQLEPASN